MPAGRPSDYDEILAALICARLMDGESLRTICLDEEMPARSTVHLWLAQHAQFSDQYGKAREFQADTIFDEILDIADDGSNDWMEKRGEQGENLGWKENGEAIARSRLRVDARKWMAGKLRSKKYGDKIDHEHGITTELAGILLRIDGTTRAVKPVFEIVG
jgi:hypothetical protein